MSRRNFWLSFLLLAAAAAAMLYPVVFGGQSLTGGDLINSFLPYKHLIVQEIRAGEFPHWNPLTFSGRPLQADIQTGVFYIPNALFLLLSENRAFDILCLLHFWWLAAGALLFFRRTLNSPGAAFLAAAIFTFGGFFTAQLWSGILLFLFTGAWLPWMLLCCERMLRGRCLRACLALGACGAMQLLAGSPQIAFYSWQLIGLYVLTGAIVRHRFGREALFPLLAIPAAATLMLGLTAVQWMPTREFLAQSFDRAQGATLEFVADGSLKLPWVSTFLAPFLFQHPGNEAYYWGSRNREVAVGFWDFNAYAGTLALPLALAGLGALLRKTPAREKRLAWFGIACIAVWLALATGGDSPLFRAMYRFVPGYDRFRVPGRWSLAWQLGLAALAGIGWQRIESAQGVRARRIAIGALAIIALTGFVLFFFRANIMPAWQRAYGFYGAARDSAALDSNGAAFAAAAIRLGAAATGLCLLLVLMARRPGRREWIAIAGAVVLFETCSFGNAMLDITPRKAIAAKYYADTEVRQALADVLKPGERYMEDDSVFSWMNDQNQLELFANRPILYGLPTTRGYDPINSRRYGEFMNTLAGLPPGETPRAFMFVPQIAHPKLLDLLNVRAALSYSPLPASDFKLVKTFPFGLRLYENPDPMGSVFVVPEFGLQPKMVLTRQQMYDSNLTMLARPDFDPRSDFIVDSRVNTQLLAQPMKKSSTSATVEERGFNFIRVSLQNADESFVAITQSWYPGWRSKVNGAGRSSIAIDHAFTGTRVEAGTKEVAFYYRPRTFDRGLNVSTLSLAVFLAAAAWLTIRKRLG